MSELSKEGEPVGIIVEQNKLLNEYNSNVNGLRIYCDSLNICGKKLYSLNYELANKLINTENKQRSIRLVVYLKEIISQLEEDSIITDFDVLFNPSYRIDQLKVLIEINKIKQFSVLWPGYYNKTSLIYAEEGCQDYKTFNIKDYDVTCII